MSDLRSSGHLGDPSPSTTGHDEPTLLLVTHVAIRQGPSGPQIDDQTAAGIAQWCQYFKHVTYIGIAESPASKTNNSSCWIDMAAETLGARATIVALPRAYRIAPMLRKYRQTRAILRDAIQRHRYLCFTIGGLVGDWPALAAVESINQKRRYSAWIDRVEPSIIENKLTNATWRRRATMRLLIPAMETYTRYLLRNSSVALLQGLETFGHYSRWASDPYVTYDTHTNISDQISAEQLARKTARVRSGLPLNIVYVGRADEMKGPHDWLETLERLSRNHVTFRATWIGDGPELATMRARVARSPELAKIVDLPGFEGDRNILLKRLQEADLMLFCHKTPESPRCLIEALVSGCPIVGYQSAYPKGLIQERGGGAFIEQGRVDMLANLIVHLNRDRTALAVLIDKAAASGQLYNEGLVYSHRAKLMKLA